MGETGQGRLDVVLLAHLEVLAEVLVTAPPVEMDHAEALVTAHLMEVGVSHVVLDAIGWESPVTVQSAVSLVALANSVAPVVDHSLLLVLHHGVEEEAAPQVEDDHTPKETHTVLSVEWLSLPVDVSKRIFEEACNVLERSPSLGVVTRFLRVVHELEEVAIGVLGQSSIKTSGTCPQVSQRSTESLV